MKLISWNVNGIRACLQKGFEDAFRRLSASGFRSRFRLSQKDRLTAELRGAAVIEAHARAVVAERLAPGVIPNDGRQTPYRGHPVFTP